MREAQGRVRRFHEAMHAKGAKAPIGDAYNPGIIDRTDRELRARLILEEATEAIVALVGHVTAERMVSQRLSEIEQGVGVVMQDTIEIAQELADVCVVTLGTAVAAGIDLAPVFDEVMAANERKVGPGARVREDGKLLKPEGWVGPDVAAVLARQKAGKP